MIMPSLLYNLLGMNVDNFTFKYLGVPLYIKMLSTFDCKQLVDNIMAKMKHWSTMLLNYAGRIG